MKAITRRKLMTYAAASAVVASPYTRPSWAAERKIVVRDPGGPIGAAYKKAYYEPFLKETGITVIGVTSDSEPSGLIKAMVETKNYTWDVASISESHVEVLAAQSLLEPVGAGGPNIRDVAPEYKNEFFVGTHVSASGLCYRPDLVKKVPRGWADFFDVAGFPGRRGLRKHPFDTIEYALLADGVPPAQLYPLDFDRAFKKLESVKKSSPVWWTAGAQITQAASSGEIDLIAGFVNRFGYAVDNGMPGEIIWDGATWFCEGLAILKGTPNADLCREFLEYAVGPERQASFRPQLRHGPTSPKVWPFVDPVRAKVLPSYPENIARMVKVDAAFWRKEQTRALERFNAWLVS